MTDLELKLKKIAQLLGCGWVYNQLKSTPDRDMYYLTNGKKQIYFRWDYRSKNIVFPQVLILDAPILFLIEKGILILKKAPLNHLLMIFKSVY